MYFLKEHFYLPHDSLCEFFYSFRIWWVFKFLFPIVRKQLTGGFLAIPLMLSVESEYKRITKVRMHNSIKLFRLLNKILGIEYKLLKIQHPGGEQILKRNGHILLPNQLREYIVHNKRHNEYERDSSLWVISKSWQKQHCRVDTIEKRVDG